MTDGQIPPVTALPSGLSETEKSTRLWAMFCHLSALSGLIIPFGNLIGPLLIWQIKKNDLPGIDPHGKESLNFQISVAIYSIVGLIAGFVLMFILVGIVFFVLVGVLWVANILLTIIAGVKANDGHFYRYPLTMRFFN